MEDSSPYNFAQRTDDRIRSLKKADYLTHSNGAKVICEEVLAISRLGLYLKQPGLDINIESRENNDPIDGCITVKGFWEAEYNVEITCTYSYEESLRYELLVAKGVAPGHGSIERDRESRRILAETAATDIDAHIGNTAKAILERYRAKAVKKYPRNTILVVVFDEYNLYGLRQWCGLCSAIDDIGGLPKGSFEHIYLYNAASNEIHRWG